MIFGSRPTNHNRPRPPPLLPPPSRSLAGSSAGRRLFSRLAKAVDCLFAPAVALAAEILRLGPLATPAPASAQDSRPAAAAPLPRQAYHVPSLGQAISFGLHFGEPARCSPTVNAPASAGSRSGRWQSCLTTDPGDGDIGLGDSVLGGPAVRSMEPSYYPCNSEGASHASEELAEWGQWGTHWQPGAAGGMGQDLGPFTCSCAGAKCGSDFILRGMCRNSFALVTQ